MAGQGEAQRRRGPADAALAGAVGGAAARWAHGHARSGQRVLRRGVSGAAAHPAQPGEHGSTGARTPPARPSPVALVQWAAKVAFFKLKLDQLMDSLCRVCLAESKQNLEDKRPDSHRGTCASPTGAPPGPRWTAVLGPALRPPVGTQDVHWRFANLDQLTLGESPGNAW